jgi:hypothetical protein
MKVLITICFTTLFMWSHAQHGIAVRAEVGGSYRIISSPYPDLNAMYNQHELTKIAGGLGVDYSYRLRERWMVQSGAGLQVKGYRTNTSAQYLGEFNEDNTFLEADEATQINHDFVRLQVPLTLTYFLKSVDNWHVLVGVGPSFNYSLYHSVRPDITENENEESASYGKLNSFIPGIQAHFGWMNTLPSGNDVLFLIRYDQDLKPALEAPIERYLYSFNFAFYYLWKV